MSYKTKDFYLSAYLVASGFPIAHFERDSGLTTFAFEQTDRLMKLVREYYADAVSVSPIRYGNSLKNLKCLIHSNTNYGKQHFAHNYGATA